MTLRQPSDEDLERYAAEAQAEQDRGRRTAREIADEKARRTGGEVVTSDAHPGAVAIQWTRAGRKVLFDGTRWLVGQFDDIQPLPAPENPPSPVPLSKTRRLPD